MKGYDLQRVRAATRLEHVFCFDELPSTSDWALELLAAEGWPYETTGLILADRQTAGRGRGSRAWWSPSGALTFSLIERLPDCSRTDRGVPQLALIAGLAVTRALHCILPGQSFQLKWPNDVYLHGRKLAGILVEVGSKSLSCYVIGVGVNVNNSLADAPPPLCDRAIALCDVTGRPTDRTEVLGQMVMQWREHLTWWRRHPEQLADAWRPYCMLQGRTVTLVQGKRRWVGVCQGIDNDGGLLIHTETGTESCLSGEVVRIL